MTNQCRWYLAVVGLVPAVVGAQVSAPPLASREAPLIFRGVTVVDVRDGRRLPDQAVVIVGRRIQRIAPTASVHMSKTARVVNAHGKYFIPGLWDMHVHPLNYVDIAFPLFLANGVTGVRDAGSNVPLKILVQWKREILAGAKVGPRYLISGPAIDQSLDTAAVTISQDTDQKHHIDVPEALARYTVDSLHAAGADFIKTYNLSRAMYFAVAAEARRLGMVYGGHLPDWTDRKGVVDGLEASDSGATFLDHETYLSPNVCSDRGQATDTNLARCTVAARRFRHNNTWMTPLVGGLGTMRPSGRVRAQHYLPDSLPDLYYSTQARHALAIADTQMTESDPTSTPAWRDFLRRQDLEFWMSTLTSLLGIPHAAGVPIVVGTDFCWAAMSYGAGPGVGVPETLLLSVLAGMTPLEALQTATLNPVLALRVADSLGTVETGKVADLVLLDADPLADIWNTTKVHGVVANGRYYDRIALDHLFVSAERAARVAPPLW